MYLLTSIKMLVLMERPYQVNDLYTQINVKILNVKKWLFHIIVFLFMPKIIDLSLMK